ncbi:UNVERIFIED_CONTAM: hypothetical protein Scaly_3133200 [Sesamum calycinum]|uniref:Uncharacterized protein n=1 Tax=Sesamum calycinum TaxID=2727403 RepID=A0AAW2JJZ0_9LAMI
MCMSFEYIFLAMVIPSHSNLKRLIDVYLEPLIEELLQLWHVGVRTYDHDTDWAFMMRAALMWTVNDLPAYEMAFRWSTVGVMGCPICMDDTRAFHLQHGDQILDLVYISPVVEMPLLLPDGYGSDHNWTKKSIFWDLCTGQHFLSDTTLMPCTLRKICLTIYSTRPNIMPKAVYTLGNEQKMRVCEWICGLKFPDGYAFNLACCVDMTELRMHGMKSHDCHVFMQNLIPIAFRVMLPEHVWSALTEVSIFNYPGRASGATKKKWLSGPKRHIIETYILTNCEVVTPYYESYLNELYQHHYLADPIIDRFVSTEFKDWFTTWFQCRSDIVQCLLCQWVHFQTERHNTGKSTMNCGVLHKRQLHENDDDNEDKNEDSSGDNETDDEEYEAT